MVMTRNDANEFQRILNKGSLIKLIGDEFTFKFIDLIYVKYKLYLYLQLTLINSIKNILMILKDS